MEEKVQTDPQETACEVMDRIQLVQLRTSGEPLWTRYWTFGFHKRWWIPWLAEWLSASQDGMCSVWLFGLFWGK